MLIIRDYDAVRLVQLDRAPVNALSPELVTRLREALDEAVAGDARAVVLAGRPGFFSAGLDVPALMKLDRDGIRCFFREFYWLQHELAASRLPVIAALTGHAPAGGLVLAQYCDYRVMAKGNFKIGLNEVRIGLVLGPVIVRGLERLVGMRKAELLISNGDLLDPDAALAAGIVDELSAPDETLETALRYAQSLAALPPNALRINRMALRGPLVAAFDTVTDELLDEMTAGWFESETQDNMRELVAKLGK